MKVLVVGGAGYLGSVLVKKLLGTDIEVTVLDNLLYTNQYNVPVKFIRMDVRENSNVAKIAQGFDAVVWLAAIVGDAACSLDPIRAMDINLYAPTYVSSKYSGRFIFMSSCSVYGINGGTATEESPLNPLSIYAESKVSAEKMLSYAGNRVILRLGTLHGVSDRMRFDLGVNAMALSAATTKSVNIFGNGEQYRPWLSVHDAARLICNLITVNTKAEGIFNVASQNEDIFSVAKIIQSNILVTRLHYEKMASEDKRNYRVSCIKLRDEVNGFSFESVIGDSVRDIDELVNSGRIKDYNLPVFRNAAALQA